MLAKEKEVRETKKCWESEREQGAAARKRAKRQKTNHSCKERYGGR
jgi:hypothetical protein